MATNFRTADKVAQLYIAEHLRESDRLEVWLSSSKLPYEAVTESVKNSIWSVCMFEDDTPVAVFGIGGHALSLTVSPWMLGTDRIAKNQKAFARFSLPWVRHMARHVCLLENYAHADNITSINWLKRCGFTIEPAAPYGDHKAMFHRFWMKGDL